MESAKHFQMRHWNTACIGGAIEKNSGEFDKVMKKGRYMNCKLEVGFIKSCKFLLFCELYLD